MSAGGSCRRAPATPRPGSGRGRNDDVRVEVRILGAARPVPEGGADKAARPLADRPALAAAGDAGLALEVAKCRAPGRLVRLGDRLARLLILCERVEEANALGAGEDEVKAGNGREPLLLVDELPRLRVDPLDRDCPVPDRRSQPVAARRVEAAKKRAELAVVDDASDPKRLAAAPCLDPRRLAPTGVVVVETAGDLLLVVGLLADRELGHAQHGDASPKAEGAETHMH
jgi:hypothetical protein